PSVAAGTTAGNLCPVRTMDHSRPGRNLRGFRGSTPLNYASRDFAARRGDDAPGGPDRRADPDLVPGAADLGECDCQPVSRSHPPLRCILAMERTGRIFAAVGAAAGTTGDAARGAAPYGGRRAQCRRFGSLW